MTADRRICAVIDAAGYYRYAPQSRFVDVTHTSYVNETVVKAPGKNSRDVSFTARLEARSLANCFYPSRTAVLEFALSHPAASSENTRGIGFFYARILRPRPDVTSDIGQERRKRKGEREKNLLRALDDVLSDPLRVAHECMR